MSYSRFVVILFICYFFYYVLIILYDVVFNKNNAGEQEKEVSINLDLEKEITPVNVEEYQPPQINTDQDDSDSVEFELETQGIPIEKLFAEGKSVFANVSY